MSNEKFEREFEDFLADEKSRLADLYRKLPQPEPDARLDSAIQAMAHRALNPQLVATPQAHAQRRSARWLPALGAAAGVVLAAGIAFHLGPSMHSERSETGAPASDVVSVRTLDAPPAPAPPLSPAPPPPAPAAAAPEASVRAKADKALAAPVRVPAEAPKPIVEHEPGASAAAAAASDDRPPAAGEAGKLSGRTATALQAFPEPPPRRGRSDEMDAVERKQIMAKGAWQNLHDQDANESSAAKAKPAPGVSEGGSAMEKRASPPPAQNGPAVKSIAPQSLAPAPKPAAASAAPEQAPATAGASGAATQARPALPAAALPERAASAGRDSSTAREAQAAPVPAPAVEGTAQPGSSLADERSSAPRKKEDRAAPRSSDPNARLYPEHWLENIRTMLRERKRDEALRSLAEFRRMYPGYYLPDDLRDLK